MKESEKHLLVPGVKVKIPKSKSIGCSLESCGEIKRAKQNNQDFLFINNINNDLITLNHKIVSYHDGDYFILEDIELYEEKIPEKWCIKLYPEVKKWIKDNFNSDYYENQHTQHIDHYFCFPNYSGIEGKFLQGHHTTFIIEKGYQEITLDQFNKHILKQKDINNQIKELEFQIKNFQSQLDNLKSLFKIGDWVWYITQQGDGSGELFNNIPQIIQIEGLGRSKKYSGLLSNTDFYGVTKNGGRNLSFKGIQRKATPEEIEQNQKIMIGDYEVLFDQEGYCKESCVINNNAYSLESLFQLRNLINLSNGQIKSLNVGCNGQYKVDLELLNKIISRLESINK